MAAYAQAHSIALTRHDRSHIRQQLSSLQAGDPGGTNLLTTLHVSAAFMSDVLARELLVQKVEDAVSPGSAKSGPAYHVRRFTIFFSSGSREQARKEALTLATDGAPVPRDADTRVEWIAPFRLSPDVRTVLALAAPGQFVGPFQRQSSFEVIQLLGRGNHRYGLPARRQLEARYFGSWLRTAVARAAPTCFTAGGKTTPCPGPHNVVPTFARDARR